MSDYEFWNELENIFEAVTAYQKKNIEFNKTFISPWVKLGRVFPREDSVQKNLQDTLHAAELEPRNIQLWTDLGEMFYKAGSFEEAADAYRKAIDLNPNAGWPKSNLALALAAQGKLHDAILLYGESLDCLTDDKEKAITWNRLGDAHRQLGDFENAISSFLHADELDSRYSEIRDQKYETPNYDGMDEVSGPEDEVPQDEKMESAIPGKQDSGFESFLIKVMETERNVAEESNPIANMDIAPNPFATRAMEDTNGTQNEDDVFERWSMPASFQSGAETDLPEINTAQVEASPAESAAQDISTAPVNTERPIGETFFEEYLDDFFRSTKTTGGELAGQTPKVNPIESEPEMVEAGVESDSQNPQVWNELGNVYFNSGAYENAILAYKQAIELDPQFAWAYSNLALAYAQKDGFADAILLYKRSIDLFESDKDKAITWNRLGNLYRQHQEYDMAITAYQTADELDPDNVSLALRSRFSLLGNLSKEEPAYV